jgi:protein involved in polysaccharide export with SLBB domain
MDVALADFNGDGVLDIAGAGWGTYSALRVRLGRPDAGGWTAMPIVCRGNYYALNVGDLSGDGRLDLVASSLDNRGLRAWLNRTDTDWKAFGGMFPRSGTYYGIAAADLDGDGHPGIFAANYGEGLKIWAGQPLAVKAPVAEAGRAGEAGKVPYERIGPQENDVFKIVGGALEYKIGRGDSLAITFWEGNNSTRQELVVRPDGHVSFGLVENLPVNGRTASEPDTLLTRRHEQFYKKPRVDVAVLDYQSKSVRLLSAVARSGLSGMGTGEYRLRGRTTVLDLITGAGGFAPDADLESVHIRRKYGETVSLNIYKTIIQGDLSQDIVLNDGDLAYVPTLSKEANRVYVFDEVLKPGAYTFNGSEMRLIDAISEAAGTTPFAYSAGTKVVRGDIAKPEILSADLTRLIEKGDRPQNVMLASSDMIYGTCSGFGDVKLFNDRIRPLLELVL